MDMFTENVAFDYVAWQIFAFLKENNVFHQVYVLIVYNYLDCVVSETGVFWVRGYDLIKFCSP